MVRAHDVSGIAQCILTNCSTGKQWHAQKSAFRPTSGQTSYEKRTVERKAMTALRAKEKEMKDEKEKERQVCRTIRKVSGLSAETNLLEAYTGDQRQESSKSRKGTLREDGRKDARKESGEAEEEGEEEQHAQIMS